MADCTKKFVNFLVDQTPHFQEDVIKAIHPMSGTWLGKVKTEKWPSFMGNTQYFDRYEMVFANPTREWVAKEYEACKGTPCDPESDTIGWGNSRFMVFKETRSIKTQVLCFDQIRDASHAEEHLAQIINDILAFAADTIMSYYIKKRAAQHAKRKIVANKSMDSFTMEWVTSGDNEIYLDTDVNPDNVYKLAPQLLQRLVMPLTLDGYMQDRTFGDSFPRLIELITDMETVWELDKQANTATSNGLNAYWRYTDWTTANDYWRYGLSGQIGNYTVAVDPFNLRFMYVGQVSGKYRYQLVLPYRNVSAEETDGTENWQSGHGLRMEVNPTFEKAQFQISHIWHPGAATLYVAQAESVHPQMPFMARDLAGKWQFAVDNIGCENIRRNKGVFFADFEVAWKPAHPEWSVALFHRREPPCVPEIQTCNTAPTGETQYYSSDNEPCDLWWTNPGCSGEEQIRLVDGVIVIDGTPVNTGLGSSRYDTVSALAAALNNNAVAKLLGTWSAADKDGDGNDDLVLSDATVGTVDLTMECV